MYDQLAGLKTRTDSLRCLDSLYLKSGTPELKRFVKSRGITADLFLYQIKTHPKFWHSLRPQTLVSRSEKDELEHLLDTFSTILPGYKKPRLVLLIGAITSGGTVEGRTVIIGMEIARSNPIVDLSEIRSQIKKAMQRESNLKAYVAHELVHTCQSGFPVGEIFALAKHRKLTLLNACLNEGLADFVTQTFLGWNINRHVHEYALPHKKRLLQQALADQKQHPFDYRPWLYNYAQAGIEYPDLGYFVGYCLAEKFYQAAKDKRKALQIMLRRGQYKKVIRIGWKE